MSERRPETISNDQPLSATPRAPRTGRMPFARTTGVAAALALVLAGGVATATYRGLQDTTSPADLMPASTFAEATLDLSLPGGQDGALGTFLRHFPGTPVSSGSGSTVDRLLRELFRHSSDPHADYDKDIKPWLGDRVAVAGWTHDGAPEAEILVAVSDVDAARASLRTLGAGTWPIVHGYAVFARTPELATAATRAADQQSLADRSEFTADIDRLPDDEAVTAWLDGPAVQQLLKDALGQAPGLAPFGLFGLGASSASLGRYAAGLHVSDTTLQLDLYGVGGRAAATAPATRLTQLPGGTIAALDVGDVAPVISGMKAALDLVGAVGTTTETFCSSTAAPAPAMAIPPGTPHRHRILRQLRHRQMDSGAPAETYDDHHCSTHVSPPTDPVDAFHEATGLAFPGDVQTLLGDGAVVSFGGLEVGGLPDVALRTHPRDLAAAHDLAEVFVTQLGAQTGADLAVRDVGSDLVVATSDDYATQVASAGDLGRQPRAAAALGEIPDQVSEAGYADLSRVWPLTGASASPLEHLVAIGFWGTQDGSVSHAQVRLVAG